MSKPYTLGIEKRATHSAKFQVTPLLRYTLSLMLLGFSLWGGAQPVLVRQIPLAATFITSDNLGNFYVINHKNELLKFDSTGNVAASYSNKSLGTLQSVDAHNPLRILLFYRALQRITILDNTLAELNQLSLTDMGSRITLAASGNDEAFWIYDETERKVKKTAGNLQPIQQSSDLYQMTKQAINPNFLLEYSGMVYLNNPETGILLFDPFGTYLKTIPIKNLSSFQVINETIAYLEKLQLISYNMKTLQQEKNPLPPVSDEVLSASFSKAYLYLLTKKGVLLYRH